MLVALADADVLDVRMRYLFSGELEIVGVVDFLLVSACLSFSVADGLGGVEVVVPYLLTYGELVLVVVDGAAGASRLMLRYVPPEYDGRYAAGEANEPKRTDVDL